MDCENHVLRTKTFFASFLWPKPTFPMKVFEGASTLKAPSSVLISMGTYAFICIHMAFAVEE
jgi:hypothetical protein